MVDVTECQHLLPKFLCRNCSAADFPDRKTGLPQRYVGGRGPYTQEEYRDLKRYHEVVRENIQASMPDIPRRVERYRPGGSVPRYRPKQG